MGKKEFLKFCDVESEKQTFHPSKGAIPLSSVNIDRIVISAEFSCAKKVSRYFVGYKTTKEVIPLCFAPKMRMCLKNFIDAKTFCFLALWIIPLALVC